MLQSVIPINLSAVMAAIDTEATKVTRVEPGTSCEAWRITTTKGENILRVFTKRPPRCGMAVEVAIRTELRHLNCRVAKPIISSLDMPGVTQAYEWVLDGFLDGAIKSRGQLPFGAAKDLGAVLAKLHALPTERYGIPALSADNTFTGQTTSAAEGMSQRFDLALLTEDLTDNPIVQRSPKLLEPLREVLAEISRRIDGVPGVLCHSDLHERQVLCTDNRLLGLIDFCETSILHPGWDFGSLRYFHGPATTAAAIEGYTDNLMERRALAESAEVFAVGVAIHHGNRSRLPGKAHRLSFITRFLEGALKR